jgi:hypothetical protein
MLLITEDNFVYGLNEVKLPASTELNGTIVVEKLQTNKSYYI